MMETERIEDGRMCFTVVHRMPVYMSPEAEKEAALIKKQLYQLISRADLCAKAGKET